MTSERSIPHLRDIFGINGYTSPAPVTDPYHHQSAAYKNQQPDLTTRSSTKKRRDNNKTLTSGDVKTLERHLSMKKTIRKKIMRDLQQAFVDDPNEFQNTTPEQMKAELRTEAMRFGDSNQSKKADNNFLDMLRGENRNNVCSNRDNNSMDYLHTNSAQSREYDYDSPVGQGGNEKQSFWKRFTMKSTKSKR
jgi:hypothetical protein